MNKNIEGAIIDMLPVEAKNLGYIGHDGESLKLAIEFVRGPVYVYDAVPRTVYEAFLASDAPDAFYEGQIKNAYKNRRIF